MGPRDEGSAEGRWHAPRFTPSGVHWHDLLGHRHSPYDDDDRAAGPQVAQHARPCQVQGQSAATQAALAPGALTGDPGLVLATLVGGSIAARGANAMNCYLDRDLDGLMRVDEPVTPRR